ncbi:MAG: amino acid adenylation domain-containing protein [Candidatus Aminicenantes bacterium]|jgi:amino acid adenylation domain-containing protein
MSNNSENIQNLSPGERRALLAQLLQEEIHRPEMFPLSFAQERLWFLDRLEGPNSTYNVWLVFQLKGLLQTKQLENSVNTVVQRHEILRTTFVLKDGEPMQVVAKCLFIPLPVLDLQRVPPEEQSREVQQLALSEVQKSFDLEKGPLLRLKLLKTSEKEHVLVLSMHHIISDAWSMRIFLQEIIVLYNAFLKGEPSPLPEISLQYADFSTWQRKFLTGEVLQKQLNYWKQRMADVPSLLELPTDRPRPPLQAYAGRVEYMKIGSELTKKLKLLSRELGSTLFMTLLSAFALLLSRYSGQTDIVIGTPIANRTRKEIEPLIGFFVNTLMMRIDLSGNLSFAQLVKRVRQMALESYEHQDLPFEKLVEELQPERSLSHSPLFQVFFVLNAKDGEFSRSSHLEISPLEIQRNTAKFDISLSISESSKKLRGKMEYSTALFDASSICRMLAHFQALLGAVVAQPGQGFDQLSLITETEKRRLLEEWNDTAALYQKKSPLHQLFRQQVDKTPHNIALVFEEKWLTYKMLEETSNQWACGLRKQGVSTGIIVGIMVKRSLEMMVGILAVLKAGGTYLPIDPDFPGKRLKYMLADSNTRILLSNSDLRDKHENCIGAEKIISVSPRSFTNEDKEVPVPPGYFGANVPAYLIYTSGSTGKPKGILVEHRNVVNFIKGITIRIEFGTGQSLLALTTISFDIFILETLLPLTTGTCVFIANEHQQHDPRRLHQILRENNINMLQLTPAKLKLLMDSQEGENCLNTIEHLMVGGETFPDDLFERLKLKYSGKVYNLYGPTETTVWSSWKELTTNSPVTIGTPLANTRLYILNQYSQLQPVGLAGELCIGGDGVARGYLNHPQLTHEKFVESTYESIYAKRGRIYHTGDLARWLPNGEVAFLGRKDHQIKIRGFRIELGEIENQLKTHESVKEAVVALKEDEKGDKYLAAYIISGTTPAGDSSDSTEDRFFSYLRDYLSARLPHYMLPTFFIQVERIPLTPNGKVDRKAFESHDTQMQSEVEYIAPQTGLEDTVAQIWQEVLGIDKVGINDNFFNIGGNSIKVIHLNAKLNEALKMDIPVVTMYRYLTIRSFVDYLNREKGDEVFVGEDLDESIRLMEETNQLLSVHEEETEDAND